MIFHIAILPLLNLLLSQTDKSEVVKNNQVNYIKLYFVEAEDLSKNKTPSDQILWLADMMDLKKLLNEADRANNPFQKKELMQKYYSQYKEKYDKLNLKIRENGIQGWIFQVTSLEDEFFEFSTPNEISRKTINRILLPKMKDKSDGEVNRMRLDLDNSLSKFGTYYGSPSIAFKLGIDENLPKETVDILKKLKKSSYVSITLKSSSNLTVKSDPNNPNESCFCNKIRRNDVETYQMLTASQVKILLLKE